MGKPKNHSTPKEKDGFSLDAVLKENDPKQKRLRLLEEELAKNQVRLSELNLKLKAVERSREKDPEVLAKMAIKMLKTAVVSPLTLTRSLGLNDVAELDPILKEVEKTHSIAYRGSLITIAVPETGAIDIDIIDPEDWVRVGLVSDTHLGCQEARLDALNTQYDLFVREGITDVYHAGNLVDGYVERLNGASAIVTTADDQIQYVIDHYPKRKGITTRFVTGDDHEGWWIKSGYNWGRDMEQTAMSQGREDLIYIGHVEADIAFNSGSSRTIVKVQHPGGGSSYARSYTGQKQAESFQGGEKPAILIQGHYHVSNYMVERNIHIISMPGFEDQTVFARKKRLRMEVGGAILEFKTNPMDGSVTRCRVEFNHFFDRGYYKKFLRSDKKLKFSR